jgi:hypothetical protein
MNTGQFRALELPDDGGGMSLALEVRIFLTRVFYA